MMKQLPLLPLLPLLLLFSLLTGNSSACTNDPILKDRTEEKIAGASPEPSVTILEETKDWSLLQCLVRGSFPKPKVEWRDSSGNMVPAAEPQVSERGGSYDVILQTTVTKTDNYSCVASQEEIKSKPAHIYVSLSGEKILPTLFSLCVI
ncbi:hypothetical protein KUCAC02_016857 [Chaenocephalus aceratus]|nr:hypothetical protein KUCAC02_016857 [Chaenocephalus aceratus]